VVWRSDETHPNGTTVATYQGVDTDLTITAFSNLTGFVNFGSRSFAFAFVPERELISHAECDVSDGTHLSATAYSDVAIEVAVTRSGSSEITAFALHKPAIEQTWKDYAGPVILALIATVLLRKCLAK
jgi:hypothetical protein